MTDVMKESLIHGHSSKKIIPEFGPRIEGLVEIPHEVTPMKLNAIYMQFTIGKNIHAPYSYIG